MMAYEDNGSVEGRRYPVRSMCLGNRSGVRVDSLWRQEAIQAAERARSGKKIFFSFQHSLCRVTLSF
ncbi:hypothetical protein DPMN_071588 [Dreissena polymorpha]|uniref:Uncharacterized protein n=1 Tax=Dreissena polymorpha TaxID=45954 RepID=A0A9D3Z7S7_DREPO|nr:hypothetical protein DPMN_071588 [Dreissena polymorpha]